MKFELTWSDKGPPGAYGDTTIGAFLAGASVVATLEMVTDHLRIGHVAGYRGNLYSGDRHSSVRRQVCFRETSAEVKHALEAVVREELENAIQCSRCSTVELPWVRTFAKGHDLCGRCAYWLLAANSFGHNPGNRFISGGVGYEISPEFPRHPCGSGRGFGGSPFLVLFDDGRQIFTTNLFELGHVPQALRKEFPDNAKLRHAEQDEAIKGKEMPMCLCMSLPFSHVDWPRALSPLAAVRYCR